MIVSGCPTCVGGAVFNIAAFAYQWPGFKPGHDQGYALLMSSIKSETAAQCFLFGVD